MRVAVAIFAFALTLTFVAGCGGRPLPPPPTPPPRPVPVVALTSPGPLASVHEDLACNDCHVEQSKQIDNNKCVYCHAHQPLAAMIGANRGLHASRLVAGKSCASCHLDHRGATYEQLGWPALGGRDRFDHAYAGWPLVAAHAAVACDGCHTSVTAQGRTRYLGTDRACAGCHKNQPHGIVRRDLLACDRCHTVAAWQPPKATLAFDHDDLHDARVPLLAAHREVACAKCHPNGKLNLGMADPSACDACHHQAPHAGTINATRPCAQCHTPAFATFKLTLFDHTERTRFDLGLSHNKLDCSSCHTKALGTREPSAACETCHPNRSPHKDRFKGIACAACHVSSAPYNPKSPTHPPWRIGGFDHAKNGHWQLTNKHAELICRTCHRGSAPWDFERLTPGADCKGCHQHATVHSDNTHPNGKYSSQDCLKCHTRAS